MTGPLSFRLMVFSLGGYAVTVFLAPVLGAFAAIFSVAGFLLGVASVTCAIYEIKTQPQKELKSYLGLSISATVIVLVLIFMIAVISKIESGETEKSDKYHASEYR